MPALTPVAPQNNREQAAVESGEKVQQHVGYTDAEGLVSFEVPPESKMFVVGRLCNMMEMDL